MTPPPHEVLSKSNKKFNNWTPLLFMSIFRNSEKTAEKGVPRKYKGKKEWTEGSSQSCYVRLGQVRLGQVRLGQVRLGQVRLGQVRLGQVRLGQVRLSQFRLSQVRRAIKSSKIEPLGCPILLLACLGKNSKEWFLKE